MNFSLEEFIKKVRWQKAKDGTHEYTVKEWHPELEKEFREFVHTIYEQGFKESFYGTDYVYLAVGKHTYWTMNYRVEVTILINRKTSRETLNLNKSIMSHSI